MSIKPEPHVEDNFFSPEEYGAIYDTVVKTMQRGLDEAGDKYAYMTNVTNNGFFVLNEDEEGKVKFPDSIKEKIRKKMEILVQEPVQPIGLMFARYTHDSSLPSLMPHCDKHHKKQHITVSICTI
jgi:Ribonuclease G/E